MYDYKEQRPNIFTEEGLSSLRSIEYKARNLLQEAGAVRADKLITGDAWLSLACLDYLVEKEVLLEITNSDAMGQHRIFVAGARLGLP